MSTLRKNRQFAPSSSHRGCRQTTRASCARECRSSRGDGPGTGDDRRSRNAALGFGEFGRVLRVLGLERALELEQHQYDYDRITINPQSIAAALAEALAAGGIDAASARNRELRASRPRADSDFPPVNRLGYKLM